MNGCGGPVAVTFRYSTVDETCDDTTFSYTVKMERYHIYCVRVGRGGEEQFDRALVLSCS